MRMTSSKPIAAVTQQSNAKNVGLRGAAANPTYLPRHPRAGENPVSLAALLLGSLLNLLGASNALADDYPSKAIRIVVPSAARIGQPVIVDNRPGAAGNIGTAVAAKAPPDGYTIAYLLTTTLCVNPHAYADVGFDPLKDFAPITISRQGQALLAVRSGSPIQSVKDLVSRAKAQPGKLAYASAGVGSPQHLMSERLKRLAAIDLAHVPYKGEAQYLPELVSGQLDVAFIFPAIALPQIEAGKLRALAVSSTQRFPSLPDVPTLAEAGIAGYDEQVWAGYAVPAGTPAARIRRLSEVFNAAQRSQAFISFTESIGGKVLASTPEEAAALIKSDYQRYGKIVKELGLRVE
jgi:tripartite-type tricarboxylate transporter receptor subunit TctC